jgi:DNA invertase Pin-like site-specific DNA recombinase
MAKLETTKGQLIGYARCSTAEQSLDLQSDALKAAGCTKMFSEKASGKNADRPELENALEYMREGDTLVIYKFDRLSRSTKDMLNIAEKLKERGINLKSLSDDIDTSSPYGQFFFTICAAFGQLEREMIASRTKAGLSAAKARGRVGGRKELVTKDKAVTAKKMLDEGMNGAEVARVVGLSKATMYRGIAKHCPFS